jgi:serine/threonine-protein kinase
VPIPGTDGALSPFFSPDGRQLGFVAGGKLMKVDLAGGPPLTVTEVVGSYFGGSWNEADSILFSDERGLSLVSSGGGAATLLFAPDSGMTESYRWPEFLPGGNGAVFSIFDGAVDRLALVRLRTRVLERTDVPGGNPHYVRQGYLVLTLVEGATGASSGTLVALPFDATRLRVMGAASPVAEGVQAGATSRTGKLSVSLSGAVAFASGANGLMKLVAVGRTGAVRDLGSESNTYGYPRLSPDGKRIAVQVSTAGTDIHGFDLSHRTLTRRW